MPSDKESVTCNKMTSFMPAHAGTNENTERAVLIRFPRTVR
jgi:hypothetical protein